jgi:hypothetical protein
MQSIIELLKFFPMITLILTHPLEQLSLADYHGPNSAISFLHESYYIAPHNGIVKEVVEKEGLFQVILSLDDGTEAVYSGLTEVSKKIGSRVATNEIIGIDNTISSNTKFILMFYDESGLFPQFRSKSLTLFIDRTSVDAIADGILTGTGWADDIFHTSLDPIPNFFYTQIEDEEVVLSSVVSVTGGGFFQIRLFDRKTYVTYYHLTGVVARSEQAVQRGEIIAISGNSGFSESPRLVLQFEGEVLGDDIRVIYYCGVVSENSKPD